MSDKLTINIDATALGNAGCMLAMKRTVIDGYTDPLPGANLIYGVAVHKFIDIMYKTRADYRIARDEAIKSFSVPKSEPSRQSKHLMDKNHMLTVCFSIWETYIKEHSDELELIELMLPCWKCRGTGNIPNPLGVDMQPMHVCDVCRGAKTLLSPSTEVTFSIAYYEDENIIVNLCGTIDRIAKIKNGVFCIRDWKTTSGWDTGNYFKQYELSRQLRMYRLALRLMAGMHPDSILGQIGSQPVGCFIDAVFLKPAANDVKVISGDMLMLKDKEIDEFKGLLDNYIGRLSKAVETNTYPKEGILNGACNKQWGKCMYWNVCVQSNPDIGELLLKRDFKVRDFQPLSYNE